MSGEQDLLSALEISELGFHMKDSESVVVLKIGRGRLCGLGEANDLGPALLLGKLLELWGGYVL